jgi:hypothetical protein
MKKLRIFAPSREKERGGELNLHSKEHLHLTLLG